MQGQACGGAYGVSYSAGTYGGTACGGAYSGVAYAGAGGGTDMRPGDWTCPACFDLQFARNAACRRCGTPRPGSPGGSVPGQQAMTAATFYGPPGEAVVASGGRGGGGLEMRPGDWICPRCNDHVFAKNDACRRCSTPRPTGNGSQAAGSANGYTKPIDWNSSPAAVESGHGSVPATAAGGVAGHAPVARPGDWICPSCNDLQFARNASCRRCGQMNPSSGGFGQQQIMAMPCSGGGAGGYGVSGYGGAGAELELRPGDWICPRCNDHVFARNSACRRCSTPRPATDAGSYTQASYAPTAGGNLQSMKPGDWICPQCKDLQFARNTACRRCSAPRPAESGTDDGQRARSRSPHRAS